MSILRTSSSKRAGASRSAGTTRASGATGIGKGVSAAVGGLKQELLKPGKRRALLAGAAFALCMTLLFASITIWWGLSNVMDQSWAALIVTAAWALICALLYLAGKRQRLTRTS